MNATTNYGLSQWESSDRIMMENFNSDNAKIDAALKTLQQQQSALQASLQNAQQTVLLRTIITSVNTQQIDLDISDINWSAYRHILLHIDLVSTDSAMLFIRLNNLSGNSDYSSPDDTLTWYTGNNWGRFYPNYGSAIYHTVLEVTGGVTYPECLVRNYGKGICKPYCCVKASGNPPVTLNLINTAGTTVAGATISICGVKK